MVPEEELFIVCRLSELMEKRGMSLNELSKRVGITLANLS
ncbi:MAG: helix-turn-helix transcriptional regulator, partial [Microbacteriaceae bacterium]